MAVSVSTYSLPITKCAPEAREERRGRGPRPGAARRKSVAFDTAVQHSSDELERATALAALTPRP